ncbi:M15 family metallopeptidase [Paenibacillus sp. SYP-B4298]|uniref:M15 family metallopeptidase n=1 Tax=Paenibacillus sp. SYP-B4298 TaxID=2996034 RepID=UPI0022DE5E22|nr:M15 family metallopeptidase [Paenibacillus sp. SYP-B4298]
MNKLQSVLSIVALCGLLLSACSSPPAADKPGSATTTTDSGSGQSGASDKPAQAGTVSETDHLDGQNSHSSGNGGPVEGAKGSDDEQGQGGGEQPGGKAEQTEEPSGQPAVETAADPESIAVLVNKQFSLPEDFEPTDLVYPEVRFTFTEKIEKRMLRKEAAAALESMFAAAEQDGIYLAGVSAYRSHSTQTALFNRYVKRDGEEKAKTYSAVPGHSEHETGLAIDVSASDGKCAAEDCFADTKEAKWLAKHVHEYGFIIRYPKGKDDITGYKYEPWHLRYVGDDIARDIQERDITLEEYYDAVPVNKPE